jgi:hypothetical protein
MYIYIYIYMYLYKLYIYIIYVYCIYIYVSYIIYIYVSYIYNVYIYISCIYIYHIYIYTYHILYIYIIYIYIDIYILSYTYDKFDIWGLKPLRDTPNGKSLKNRENDDSKNSGFIPWFSFGILTFQDAPRLSSLSSILACFLQEKQLRISFSGRKKQSVFAHWDLQRYSTYK